MSTDRWPNLRTAMRGRRFRRPLAVIRSAFGISASTTTSTRSTPRLARAKLLLASSHINIREQGRKVARVCFSQISLDKL